MDDRTHEGENGQSCMQLSDLPVGWDARLCAHPDATPTPPRLMDLGVVPDTPLRVLRQAPFGDPVEIEIRGYRICVRRRDLERICVRPEPTPTLPVG